MLGKLLAFMPPFMPPHMRNTPPSSRAPGRRLVYALVRKPYTRRRFGPRRRGSALRAAFRSETARHRSPLLAPPLPLRFRRRGRRRWGPRRSCGQGNRRRRGWRRRRTSGWRWRGDGVHVQYGESAPTLRFRDPIVGGVGRNAEEVRPAQRQGSGRLWEPGVVADEDPDLTERSIEDRQVLARFVE